MFSCPGKHTQEWKDLVKEFGETKAMYVYVKNKYDIPSVEKAKKLLDTKTIKEKVTIGMVNSMLSKANQVRAKEGKTPLRLINDESKLNGALARVSDKDGTINISRNITPELVLRYLGGLEKSETSAQKKKVLEKLEAEDFSYNEIKDLLETPDDVFNFLLFHELSHVINSDSSRYPKTTSGSLDYENPTAIEIETRATVEALHTLRAIKNDEIVEKANAAKGGKKGNNHSNKNVGPWDEIVEATLNALKLRKEYFETLLGKEGFEFAQVSISRIDAILTTSLSTLDKKLMFKRLLNDTTIELDKIKAYLADPVNKTKPDYLRNLIEFKKYISTYRGLTRPDLVFDEKTGKDVARLSSQLTDLNHNLPEYIIDAVKDLAKTYLSKGKSMTEEELDKMMKETYDISLSDAAFRDISTSTDKLLALVDKIYKEAQQKSLDKLDSFETKVKALGRKLNNLGVTSFDWMFEKGAEGITGNYIRKISKKYYEKYRELMDALKDDHGDKIEYKHITDPEKASKEDIEHNKKLKAKKEAFANFTRPEKLEKNENGKLVAIDGPNNKYTDEFKKIRDKYEVLVEVVEGFYQWEKRENVSYEDYAAYRFKYYTEPKMTLSPINTWNKMLNKYQFLGKTEYREKSYVKSEFVETREDVWANEEYTKLMNDNSEVGKAKKEFYEFFVNQLEDSKGLLSVLPKDIKRDLKGRIPVVVTSFKKQLLNGSESKLQVLGRALKGLYNVDVFAKKRQTDEKGVPISDVPIYNTQRIKNPKKIETLKTRIAELESKKDSMKPEEYKLQIEKYKKSLAIEESKPTASEMETDLVEVLLHTANMAYNYEAMKNVESSILAIKDVVETRQYYGQSIDKNTGKPVLKEGKDSLAAKRLETWMRMVFYDNSEMDNTKIAKISKTILKYNSLKGIGLNPFSAINNYIMARINTSIEAAGGRFFKQSSGNRATALFNSEFMPNVFKEINNSKYADKKSASKYSAVVRAFRFIRHQASIDGRTSNGDVFDFAYALQDGGEFAAQSRSGIAILMDTYNIDGQWMVYSEIKAIHGEQTDNFLKDKKSLYDSIEFDPVSGQAKLPEDLSDKDRHMITNRIVEMNKYIHGNYAWEDRMAIQEHWLGQFAAQFHKWVYPAIKSRFGKEQHYEGIDMDMKGRYITLFEFIKHAKFNVAEYYQHYNSLSDLDKANMRKNMRELAFFMISFALFQVFSAISEGIDDDDEELKKVVNFLAFQQNRQMQEIQTLIPIFGIRQQYDLIKSPLAAVSTVKEGGEMLKSMVATPFYASIGQTEENFYKKGIHKGDLKLWKETKDFLPFLTIFNKYDNFINQQEFWVK